MKPYSKNDPASIQQMFNHIAKNYDFTNGVLSFQFHKYWNRQLVKHVIKNHPHTYLDLCCGTGDIAQIYLKKVSLPTHVYLVDFCTNMLTFAKNKIQKGPFSKNHIYYLEADAQKLPLPNATVDCTTIAYGIRNVQNTSECIKETYRVLKSGGCLGILELTQPKNSVLKFFHTFYLKNVLPILGKWLTKDQKAYSYLQSSIQSFISPMELKKIMEDHQFKNIKVIPLTGGIATLLIGYKE